jgi:hypothetical protein
VDQDFGQALLMSLKLNEQDLIRETLEQIPVNEVELVSSFAPFLKLSCSG